MRVSVVASGIDAAVEAADTPVPRRRLEAPLTTTVSVESDRPAAVAESRPAGSAVAERTEAAQALEEPTLFHDLDPVPAAPRQPVEAQDDLPPPAYVPQSSVAEAPASTAAARAHAPGTPSPETLRRLEAAVRKVPDEGRQRAAGSPVSDPAQPGASTDRTRFGINSLINRMTGHTADPRASGGRTQPPMQSLPDDRPEEDADLDKIEIPAFLRRQAN